MRDTIYRDEAIKVVGRILNGKAYWEDILDTKVALSALPSAEAVQGEWIDIDNYYRMATCSHCRKVTMFEKWGEYTKPYNFCPNCGAKMNKGGDAEVNETKSPYMQQSRHDDGKIEESEVEE